MNERDADEELWRCYNTLLLSPDRSRVSKLITRYQLFAMSRDVPGHIIECGVYKGVGLLYWAKLLEISAANSRKRVIGFDAFGPFREVGLREQEYEVATRHDAMAGSMNTMERVAAAVAAAGFSQRVELVAGDVVQTAPAFADRNYGLRISLLNLDLDTYEGTTAALRAFWPLMSRGGVVIFDEYGLAGMGESQAVDEFFADLEVRPRTLPEFETPTAFLIKP
jgi:hypothetical protein